MRTGLYGEQPSEKSPRLRSELRNWKVTGNRNKRASLMPGTGPTPLILGLTYKTRYLQPLRQISEKENTEQLRQTSYKRTNLGEVLEE